MHYDFDKVIDRRGFNTYKTGNLMKYFGREDLIPLWVADMDFETPDFIIEAIRKRLEHPVLGYQMMPAPDDYYTTVSEWVNRRHGWEVPPSWISYIPGIVKGIGLVVNLFSEPGDKVIIQTPVYHPFRLVPEGNGREVVFNPLKLEAGTYKMDFEQLEHVIDERCKLLIVSNPHNPGGVLWTVEELQQLAVICAKHKILVISDEIHGEMAFMGKKHHPFATVSETAAQNSITFMAPSKTFNIAGVVSSYAIVPNDEIRSKFFGFLNTNELGDMNIFSYEATKAAYQQGDEWLEQMLYYVMVNCDYVSNYIEKNIPGIKCMHPDASFLMWLDCRGLGLSHKELIDLFVNRAQLALNDGRMFGPDGTGEGWMRLNVGCPRCVLQQALQQLYMAIKH